MGFVSGKSVIVWFELVVIISIHDRWLMPLINGAKIHFEMRPRRHFFIYHSKVWEKSVLIEYVLIIKCYPFFLHIGRIAAHSHGQTFQFWPYMFCYRIRSGRCDIRQHLCFFCSGFFENNDWMKKVGYPPTPQSQCIPTNQGVSTRTPLLSRHNYDGDVLGKDFEPWRCGESPWRTDWDKLCLETVASNWVFVLCPFLS